MTPDAVGAGDLAGWGAAAATAPSAVIHPVYLPFTSERLMAHFADTSLGGQAHNTFSTARPGGPGTPRSRNDPLLLGTVRR